MASRSSFDPFFSNKQKPDKVISTIKQLFALALLCAMTFASSCSKAPTEEPTPPKVPVTGINISHKLANLLVSETLQLSVDLLPETATDTEVTWSSDNPSVVSVDQNGLARALAHGIATLKVVSNDGGFAAICTVNSTINATGLSLNKTSTNMATGESITLIATILPADASDKRVVWSSTNSGIASVDDNGVVKAIKAGVATIKASSFDSKLSATCIVTIADPVISVTGVTLSKSAAELLPGATLSLSSTVAPASASDKRVSWSSNKVAVATVNANGLVTAIAEGVATIKVTTTDGGFIASCVVTVKGLVTEVTNLTLNRTSATMTIGESLGLIATITPADATDKRVNWSSNNTAVATVDASGMISALNEGSATIKATSANGLFSATCTVSVTKPSQSSSVTGEWMLSQWASSPNMEGKVWMILNQNNTFELYQSIGNQGYAKFTGNYTHNSSAQTLSGVYSDGVVWARSYSIKSLATNQMVLVDSTQPTDISVYDRHTVPAYVKDGVTGTRSAQVERFL